MTLSRDRVHDLRDLAAVWPVATVLIGAAALGFSHGLWWRTTSDLDLVLAIELTDLAEPLPSGWQRTRIPHRFMGPEVPASISYLPRLRCAPLARSRGTTVS